MIISFRKINMKMDKLQLVVLATTLTCLYLIVSHFSSGGPVYQYKLPDISDNTTEIFNCNASLVTAYYKIPSKHSHSEYISWMVNFLSLRDCMVIFVSPELIPLITSLRPSTYPTVIIPRPINSLRMAGFLDDGGWETQEMMDPEQNVGHNRFLYWIWNEKTEMMKITADINPFSSHYFIWLDIGAVRDGRHNHDHLVRNIPKDPGVLLLQVDDFTSSELSNNSNPDFSRVNRIGGGTIGADKDTLSRWHSEFYSTVSRFITKGKFIGKDQNLMATVCLETSLCLMVKSDLNHWFLLQDFLRGDKNINYYKIVNRKIIK